jgi:hypothetical protein
MIETTKQMCYNELAEIGLLCGFCFNHDNLSDTISTTSVLQAPQAPVSATSRTGVLL